MVTESQGTHSRSSVMGDLSWFEVVVSDALSKELDSSLFR